MVNRHIVQIPAEQVKKLSEIDSLRKDLSGYPLSRKVHVLLQEKLSEIFQNKNAESREPKGEWLEYIRECLPTHVIAPICLGVVRYSKEMIGTAFTKLLVASEADKTWWCNYKDDIYNVGGFLLEHLKDANFASKYYKEYDVLYNKMRGLCDEFRGKSFNKLSNKEFLRDYSFFFGKFQRFHARSFDIDALDIMLEEKMKEGFKELFLKKQKEFVQKDFTNLYNTIITPSELSYLGEEQLKIYWLAQEIKKNKRLDELFRKDAVSIRKRLEAGFPQIHKKLMQLEDDYWWTSLGWVDRTEKAYISFIADIRKVMREDKDVGEEIERLNSFVKEIREKKKELEKEFNFTGELRYLIEVFDHFVKYHDYRKEIQMKGTAVMNYFLFEFSRRFGIKYDDLVWCWPGEIMDLAASKHLNLDVVRKRKEAYFVLVTKEGIEELTGEEAIFRRKKELKADTGNVRDFKGIISSLGKVSGKAKVCYSATDALKKIKKGDILVASMTMPDYVPAMKKAAAIVTDEGGVTCHASIISRELKIPCIVGTRIATKVINDNDTIEVNANHGVVKILKRAL